MLLPVLVYFSVSHLPWSLLYIYVSNTQLIPGYPAVLITATARGLQNTPHPTTVRLVRLYDTPACIVTREGARTRRAELSPILATAVVVATLTIAVVASRLTIAVVASRLHIAVVAPRRRIAVVAPALVIIPAPALVLLRWSPVVVAWRKGAAAWRTVPTVPVALVTRSTLAIVAVVPRAPVLVPIGRRRRVGIVAASVAAVRAIVVLGRRRPIRDRRRWRAARWAVSVGPVDLNHVAVELRPVQAADSIIQIGLRAELDDAAECRARRCEW